MTFRGEDRSPFHEDRSPFHIEWRRWQREGAAYVPPERRETWVEAHGGYSSDWPEEAWPRAARPGAGD